MCSIYLATVLASKYENTLAGWWRTQLEKDLLLVKKFCSSDNEGASNVFVVLSIESVWMRMIVCRKQQQEYLSMHPPART